MRISQLSAESGVPIPTIKYYLREGLLPQGDQTAATRAEYDQSHLRRLRLIRALLEVGRLPVATIRKVIDAVEDERLSVHDMLGAAHYALSTPVEPHPEEEDWRGARELVDEMVADLGWGVHPLAPARDELTQTVVTLKRLGMPTSREDLLPYATAALELVREQDITKIPFDGPRDVAVETLVICEVLYGKAFDVLRRLAQESESARILDAAPCPEGGSQPPAPE
ncbi:MerR family transcriptional regulator [Microtetraspora sp. AC03309]|uniref:MerR family transcriptional regulator n=1 Tax=Microtetraspora sp. AC03309 TaxID=2779376 RepID=UPI001E3E6C7C|nr:MerR family transcriptional regulator [Microtetraspora sp. AC03309]MCC5578675.1 MerR family transcriptional regulator [Microtetraspora sp. AC03309]